MWRVTLLCWKNAIKLRWNAFSFSMHWRMSMRTSKPGEIWRIDFGMAAKIRPALILSDFPADDELALLVVIPHTTAVKGNRWECVIPKAFLRPGAFHLQQVQPIPIARLESKMGILSDEEFQRIKSTLSRLLHLHA